MLEYDFFCLLKKANTLTVAFFHFHKMWICEEPFSLLLTKGPIASLMPGLVILFILLLEHSLEAKWILDIGWFVAFWLQIFSCTCLMLILLSFTMLWSMKGLCGSWCFHVHGHIFFFLTVVGVQHGRIRKFPLVGFVTWMTSLLTLYIYIYGRGGGFVFMV